MKILVGIYHEREARELSRCPGYYAADYENHITIPGDYPLYVEFVSGYQIPMPYWVLCGIKSRVTGGRLFNGFGGLNFSSEEIPPRDAFWPIQTYDYMLHSLVKSGFVSLFPEWAWLADLDTGRVIEYVRENITWDKLRQYKEHD